MVFSREIKISTGRTFGLFRKGHLLFHENIEGTGDIAHFDRPKALRGICDQVKVISEMLNKKFGDVVWSIEGFWKPDAQSFDVLQMRPTSVDRPLSPLTELRGTFYDTHFCWGLFQTPPFAFYLNDLPAWLYVRKDAHAKTLPEVVVERLKEGSKMLLIDTMRGFVLSHEQWFLPRPSLRENYGFLYVPMATLQTIEGQSISFISSRRRGYGIFQAI